MNVPTLISKLSFDCVLTSWHWVFWRSLEASLLSRDKTTAPNLTSKCIKQGDSAGGSINQSSLRVNDSHLEPWIWSPWGFAWRKGTDKVARKVSIFLKKAENLVLKGYPKRLRRWLSTEEWPWHTSEDWAPMPSIHVKPGMAAHAPVMSGPQRTEIGAGC